MLDFECFTDECPPPNLDQMDKAALQALGGLGFAPHDVHTKGVLRDGDRRNVVVGFHDDRHGPMPLEADFPLESLQGDISLPDTSFLSDTFTSGHSREL